MTYGKEEWDIWHEAQQCADRKDWNALRGLFERHPDTPLPFHDFTRKAFWRAAAGGQADILSTMMSRGFSMDAEMFTECLTSVVKNSRPAADDVIVLLARHEKTDISPAAYDMAARGDAEGMRLLHAAIEGDKEFPLRSVFFIAILKGQEEVLRDLAAQGASPFFDFALRMQRGEIALGKQEEAADLARGTAVLDALLQKDREEALAAYACLAPMPVTADDFRRAAGTHPAHTVLLLALRAGREDDVIRAGMAADEKNLLGAGDLTVTDKNGTGPLEVIVARGIEKKFLSPDFWRGDLPQAMAFNHALRALVKSAAVEDAALAADFDAYRLRRTARPSLRLKPSRSAP